MHEQEHVAKNIALFGAHRNVHTGPQEHNHIEIVKCPSKCSQKYKAVFDLQISERLVNCLIIDHTYMNILQHQCKQKDNKQKWTTTEYLDCTQQAQKFALHIALDQHTDSIELQYQWITGSQKNRDKDKSPLKWLVKLFFKPLPKSDQEKAFICGVIQSTKGMV